MLSWQTCTEEIKDRLKNNNNDRKGNTRLWLGPAEQPTPERTIRVSRSLLALSSLSRSQWRAWERAAVVVLHPVGPSKTGRHKGKVKLTAYPINVCRCGAHPIRWLLDPVVGSMNPQPDTGIVGRVSYRFAFSSFRREPVYRWPGKEGRTDGWAALFCTAQVGIRT